MNIQKAVLALALALPLGALAENQQQLVAKYTSFAGSEENATSLVTGLRDSRPVTLAGGGTTAGFTPPTQKMGYGNVDNALALAQASLKSQGIANPTPAQLQASVTDVLRMRADGKGWGQIANSLGFKLGEVKRPDKAAPAGTGATAERGPRPEKPERPERPEKPERHGKAR